MRILLINQTFHPDVVSSAQHLTDVARALSESGHDVIVIAGDRGYDDQSRRFPRKERWNNITIFRVPSSRFGKGARWRRAVDIATFLVSCTLLMTSMRNIDLLVAMTSPPLISAVGATFARARGWRFVSWVMDLNPDEAVAAGWLKPGSAPARVLEGVLAFSLRTSDRIIVLDRFARATIERKGIASAKISIIPPWSHDDLAVFDAEGRETFRHEHGLQDKFVVMYAGNHSPCNPLDTLIAAADVLRTLEEVVFCFVGGGSEFTKLQSIVAQRQLSNVRFVPYQPRARVAAMLSAGDLHTVVMGDPFVGIIHPCKIYNVLQIDSPVLYVGPKTSHIADLLSNRVDLPPVWTVRHGDVQAASRAIVAASQARHVRRRRASEFSQQALVPRFVKALTEQLPSPHHALDHIELT